MTEKNTMAPEVFQKNVLDWAYEKGIFAKSSPLKQLGKTEEEVAETKEVLEKLEEIRAKGITGLDVPPYLRNALRLEIGDIYVTTVILANLCGFSLDECGEAAFKKIANRSGDMVDGVFVKEADLKRAADLDAIREREGELS